MENDNKLDAVLVGVCLHCFCIDAYVLTGMTGDGKSISKTHKRCCNCGLKKQK